MTTYRRFFFGGLLATIAMTIATSASAQSFRTEDASGRESAPFNDSAVVPVDFQRPNLTPPVSSWISSWTGNESAAGIANETDKLNEEQLDGDSAPSWVADLKNQFSGIDVTRVFGSLAIVLGGYFGFVWLTRRLGSGGSHGLPEEVVEVLGQSPFGPKKSLQLVRLGSKLLLLMHNGEGTHSVGEITDPHEVEYLVSLCGGKANRSAIAIRKASTANRNSNPHSDLKQILRQLQQSSEGPGKGSVFDA